MQPPSQPLTSPATLSLVDRYGKTYSYKVTAKDALTLARALNYEGAPAAAVAWAYLQRLAYYAASLTKKPDALAWLVSHHSQPINPRWFLTGNKHKAWYEKRKAAGAPAKELRALEMRARRRPAQARIPWSRIKPEIRSLVTALWQGQVPNPIPGGTDFHASRKTKAGAEAYAEKRGWRTVDSGAGWSPGVNVFYAQPGSDRVRVGIDPKAPSPKPCCCPCSQAGQAPTTTADDGDNP